MSKPSDQSARATRSTETSAHPALLESVGEHQDRAAFTQIFDYYAPRLKGYLIRTGAPGGVVEELVQDVMLTVWRRASSYKRGSGSVSTWLYTIARNAYIDHLRREKRPTFDVNDPAFELASDEDVEADVLMRENAADLTAAIATLAPEQREVINQFYFKYQSHSQIATELNLPLGTVKSRVRLAVEHLRRTLRSHR